VHLQLTPRNQVQNNFFSKSSESVQCALLKACDACADMDQLQRTVRIRKTFRFFLTLGVHMQDTGQIGDRPNRWQLDRWQIKSVTSQFGDNITRCHIGNRI